jgi:phosphotransferase system  glucose/maltose/N-acetylglucosamine-specific IIC component
MKDYDDELEHLRANYWGATVLCGLFLGVFLFMLQQQQHGLMVFCIGAITLLCAFFSLRLSAQLRKLKKERRNIRTR